MDSFVVGLVLMAAIGAIIGYFFLKAAKSRPDRNSRDSGSGSWAPDGADGGGDGGGGGD
ncbi:hypothetical protein [Rhizobium sp. LjRoot254]|uniref:hypothetical protein n=1 Tax=Rhizobium sp. LjRoot254 TaxID=3342297 RepID=UPI003ECFDB59